MGGRGLSGTILLERVVSMFRLGRVGVDSCGGDRVRTSPLSVKSAVEVVQVICQSKIFHRVGGFGFAACDHLKAFPD